MQVQLPCAYSKRLNSKSLKGPMCSGSDDDHSVDLASLQLHDVTFVAAA